MIRLCIMLAACVMAVAQAAPVNDAASKRQPNVPQGVVTTHHLASSDIYPGTSRDYWVYVPKQYDAKKPASLMVFQDGEGYKNENGANKVPIVFDNLIHQGEMPVTIAVFINPGVVAAPHGKAQPRFNRSYEYDDFSDKYARFLTEELLPAVEQKWNLSKNPSDRGICGASSGAIAAFTAAWHRPDQFRRVYSMIGTYVGLRGGDEISTLIRKTEPKPLRIFLQDGSNDNNIYCGDWWMANQMMERSLVFSGYEVEHVWDEGQHSHQFGGALLPQAMRWLWKDAAKGVQVRLEQNRGKAKELLIAGENWQEISKGHGFTEGPVAAADGTVFFSDIPNNVIHTIGADGKVAPFLQNTQRTNGLAFGPDGQLYGCKSGTREIVSWNVQTKQEKVHARDVEGNDLVVAHDGMIYVTEPRTKSVWLIRPGGVKVKAAGPLPSVNGITLTPDQSRVEISDPMGRFVWSAQRKADGSLVYLQPYHHLHLPGAAVDVRSGADGMKTTADGWLLVATVMGVQICDQPGRVNLILPPPTGARHASNLCFGGKNRDVLYLTCGDKIFRRKVNMRGAVAWDAPIMPPKPGL